MFNSPLLDVAIGLVFIFLLYSLLATSVKEAIATAFAFRARMLKTAIVDRMLANTSNDGRWVSIAKGFSEFFLEIWKMIKGKREKSGSEIKIGDKFYEHPLITNYGSSRVFPTPSYIPTKNFSTVLIDVMKEEFDKRIDEIANYKLTLSSNNDTLADIKKNLQYSSDIIKIKELLDYYTRHYKAVEKIEKDKAENKIPNKTDEGFIISGPLIDEQTVEILQMHIHNAYYSFEKFTKKIEDWFDDSMNRVTGWYKRQVQAILFFIGIVLAITFNVDTIEISGKLSTDKDARDKLVQFAEQSVDKYKDDPNVIKVVDKNGNLAFDTSAAARHNNDSIFKVYQVKTDQVKKYMDSDFKKANDIIALGWGDYGKRIDSARVVQRYLDGKLCFTSGDKLPVIPDSLKDEKNLDSLHKKKLDSLHKIILETIYHNHWVRYKIPYILKQSMGGKKLLGFLLTAFAICLGAPFWFDLLNKLVKLRAAGKKEDDTSDNNKTNTGNPPQPITVNVNGQPGEEAVG